MALTVSEIPQDESSAWDAYVESHADGTFYHRSAWRSVISDVFGKQTHYLAAKRDGEFEGALPLVRLRSVVFGDFLVSLPYVTYGGIVSDNEEACAALFDAAGDLAGRLGVRHVELRHTADLGNWAKRTDKVTMKLELTGDPDTLFKQIGAKRRSQIKRPIREGVEATIGGAEQVEAFYEVFSRKYRDLGVPVYPLSWFRRVVTEFGDASRVFVVRLGEQVVAASIVFGYKNVVEVPWAASLRSADRFGVNMFLYWQMLEWAEKEGFQAFDFGRCTEGSGTWRFKKQWGAEQVPLYWHYWLRDGQEVPRLNADNPRFSAAVSMWRRLPVWMANRIGPQIVKNLP